MPVRRLVALLASAAALAAGEPDYHCPLYAAPLRFAEQLRQRHQREFQNFSEAARKATAHKTVQQTARFNFIDDYIFGKTEADGIPAAPLTDDYEFLRRISLDLTGRIPSPETVNAFTADTNPAKRTALIQSLIGSQPYIDKWTHWFADRFQAGSNFYNFISIQSRNLFYRYVRDMVERDRPYNDFVSEIIGSAGDSFTTAPVNFLVRAYQVGDPAQDTWDALTNSITTNFLGVQTQCVSCHDGRRHLEPINLYLLGKRRADFWRQAAFLSRMNIAQQPVNAYGSSNRLIIQDRGVGGYSSVVPSSNPGPRPSRYGGPYTPQYLFGGAAVSANNWRADLARAITQDRQFARATVNYIWAAIFTVGIVDPPDNWDLLRIDPNNPPANGFPLQASHPQLLEALASEFIDSGYSVRHMIQLMVQSNVYQLSSRTPDGWKDLYRSYFAKHIPRRLTAEEIYDAVTAATGTQTPMYVEGFDQPLLYAMQLPDTTEPRSDGTISYFLNQFGRGDWFNAPRNSNSTILQILFLMNDYQINARTFASRQDSRSTRVATLLASKLSEDEMVRQLFLATLGRPPSGAETAALQRDRQAGSLREDWLADIQWALLNKLDFLFDY